MSLNCLLMVCHEAEGCKPMFFSRWLSDNKPLYTANLRTAKIFKDKFEANRTASAIRDCDDDVIATQLIELDESFSPWDTDC